MKDLCRILKGKMYLCNAKQSMQSMEAISIKQSLLSTISGIDDRDTGLLEKLVAAVKNILQQNSNVSSEDGITPYVDSMKVGMKLPADLDIKALREEHINEKYS